MIDKRELTKKFLVQLSLPADTKTIRKYHIQWWMNPRSSKNNGLRLTDLGYKVLVEQLGLKSYNITFPEETEWNSKLILHCEKFLDSPYYIERKSLVVFKEKTAIELVLFSGDIQKYTTSKLKSLEKSKEST